MAVLNVNLNKIAWPGNSRVRDRPNVDDFAGKFFDLRVCGITATQFFADVSNWDDNPEATDFRL